MNISNVSISQPYREVNEKAASLAFNLSPTDRIGQRIDLVNDRKDRAARQQMLRDSLSLRSSIQDLQRQFKKARAQADQEASTTTPQTASASSVGISAIEQADLIQDVSPQLDGINSGTFSINGVDISINRAADSLDDVINAINSSGAGVTASYDSATGQLSLSSSDTFTLDDGSSNFFTAMEITEGTYELLEEERVDGQDNFLGSKKFLETFKRFTNRLNNMFKTLDEVKASRFELEEDSDDFKALILETLEDSFKSNFDAAFSSEGRDKLEFGISFNFESEDQIMKLDIKAFDDAIAKDSNKLYELFMNDAKDDGQDGLAIQMIRELSEFNEKLTKKIGSAPTLGGLVNTIA